MGVLLPNTDEVNTHANEQRRMLGAGRGEGHWFTADFWDWEKSELVWVLTVSVKSQAQASQARPLATIKWNAWYDVSQISMWRRKERVWINMAFLSLLQWCLADGLDGTLVWALAMQEVMRWLVERVCFSDPRWSLLLTELIFPFEYLSIPPSFHQNYSISSPISDQIRNEETPCCRPFCEFEDKIELAKFLHRPGESQGMHWKSN